MKVTAEGCGRSAPQRHATNKGAAEVDQFQPSACSTQLSRLAENLEQQSLLDPYVDQPREIAFNRTRSINAAGQAGRIQTHSVALRRNCLRCYVFVWDGLSHPQLAEVFCSICPRMRNPSRRSGKSAQRQPTADGLPSRWNTYQEWKSESRLGQSVPRECAAHARRRAMSHVSLRAGAVLSLCFRSGKRT